MTAMSAVLRELMARDYIASRLGEALSAGTEVAPDASPAVRVRLWLVQLLLPDLVLALEELIVSASPRQQHVRRMAGGLLTYVYNPLGLIPDNTPFGRVDDTLICALGLKRLHQKEKLDLSPEVLAICGLAEAELVQLSKDLQEDIRAFVRDLEQAT